MCVCVCVCVLCSCAIYEAWYQQLDDFEKDQHLSCTSAGSEGVVGVKRWNSTLWESRGNVSFVSLQQRIPLSALFLSLSFSLLVSFSFSPSILLLSLSLSVCVCVCACVRSNFFCCSIVMLNHIGHQNAVTCRYWSVMQSLIGCCVWTTCGSWSIPCLHSTGNHRLILKRYQRTSNSKDTQYLEMLAHTTTRRKGKAKERKKDKKKKQHRGGDEIMQEEGKEKIVGC